MFAFEIPGLRFSMPAGADVERFRFVLVNSDSTGVTATANTPVVGVSMNKVKENEVLEIADGIVMVEAGAEISAGATVAPDAEGRAVTAMERFVGVALTAASSAGDIISVKM